MAADERRAAAAFVVALAACAVVLAIVEWRAGLLLTNDGPQRLYASYVAAHLDDPALGYARFWDVIPTITGRGFSVLFALAHAVLDWQQAYRVVLVVALEAWAFAAVLLVRALDDDDRKRWLALVAFPLAPQWCFYLGFIDFFLGAAVGMVAIAVVASTSSSSSSSSSSQLTPVARLALFTALTLVGSALHVLATLLAIGAAGLFVLVTRPRAVFSLVLASLPAVAVAAWIQQRTDLVAAAAPSSWLPPLERALQLVERFALGPWWRAGAGVIALALGVAALALGTRRERAIAASGLVLVALTLALPFSGAWQLVSPRPLTLAVPCLVAAAPLAAFSALPKRASAVAGVVVLAWIAAAFAWTARLNERLRDDAGHTLAFLDAGKGARADVVRVPIILSDARVDDVPDMEPAIHAGQIAGVAWGGFMHYTQTGSSSVHPLAPRADFAATTFRAPDVDLVQAARTASGALRAQLVDVIAAEASPADEVIVLGGDDDIEHFTNRGYVARARGPGFFVGAAPKCRAHLAVALAAPGEAAVGVVGARAASYRFDVGRGASSLDLTVPCGAVFLDVTGCARVTATTSASSVGELFCDARTSEPHL